MALDVLLFDDRTTRALAAALGGGALQWQATPAMRQEFARVLGYPKILVQLAVRGRTAQDLLAGFDRLARPAPPAAPAGIACADPDDQPFVDLAVALRCPLWSKDKALLALAPRLAPLGVTVRRP